MSSPSGLRVLVCIKRVIDFAVKPRVRADHTGVDLSQVKMSMNPFCEIAVEEAVKMKDAGVAAEVVAVTLGPKQAVDTLRTALAMGADRGIHIDTDQPTDLQIPHIHTAAVMAHIAKTEKADIIITGKQSIDDDSGLVGGMIAGLLSCPQATCAAKVSVSDNKQTVTVTREVDGGQQVLQLKLPCVVTTDLRLNTPRYATLPNIMKAKKKPITTHAYSSLIKETGSAIKERPRFKLLSVVEPPKRTGGVKVETVEQLVTKLRQEAKVI